MLKAFGSGLTATVTTTLAGTWRVDDAGARPARRGSGYRGDQVLRLFATSTLSASAPGAGSLALCNKADGTRIWEDTFSLTVTPRRTGADGSSGGYQYEVVFASSGNNKADLLGSEEGQYEWRLTLGTFPTGAGTVQLYKALSGVT